MHATPEAEYSEADTGHVPTPVRPVPVIVTEAVRVQPMAARSWSAQQVQVLDVPIRLAPRSPARTRLLMHTTSGNGFLYLAPDISSCTPTTGYAQGASGTLELDTTDEVWAVCASGQAAVVHMLVEHREG